MLLVTSRAAARGFAGLAIGLVLTVIHLVGIPLDGTSVNPARSIGPALFNGGDWLAHLWEFIVFPLIGGAVAAVVAPLFETAVPKATSTRPARRCRSRSRRARAYARRHDRLDIPDA